MDTSITVVLNLYKRPHTLIEQLRAIKGQSVPPTNIVIWVTPVEGITMPEIPDDLKAGVETVVASKNYGVWARFTIGLLYNTKYVTVIDDDTIPGPNWFKNCVDTMAVKRGLLGTIGVRFNEGTAYRFNGRIGWDGPRDTIEQVDIACHSWFFEQAWLHHLWSFKPDFNIMLRAGEDIGISYCLQQQGINTYIPPHPVYRKDMWGSEPNKAMQYGCEAVSIYMSMGLGNMEKVLRDCILNRGFRTMHNDAAVAAGRNPFPFPIGDSVSHLRFFLGKLARGEPFSLIRPNDGEYLIITGTHFRTQDIWAFRGGSLREELLAAIQSYAGLDNCYVGIPCKACWDQTKTNWCKENYKIHPNRLTYGNLVCNKNWRPFTNYFIDNAVPFYYIGPGQTPTDKLNVLERYYTDPMQIERWDAEKTTFIEGVEAWVMGRVTGTTKPLIFAFSVGPLTKILISRLSLKNPGHFFLDVGSAFDLFLKGSSNRLYISNAGVCANVVCDFEKGHTEGHYAPL
jgi:hypothetical protein